MKILRCSPILLFSLSCLVILLSSCGESREGVEANAYEGELIDEAEFERRVEAIFQDMELIRKKLEGHGRGAYASGSRSPAHFGDETILERLHRLEIELNQSHKDLDRGRTRIGDMQRDLQANRILIENLKAKEERIDQAINKQQIALEERKAAISDNERLNSQLIATDKARLLAERRYYSLAAELIRLNPGQTQAFIELQDRVREDAHQIRPDDLANNAQIFETRNP